MKTVRIYNLSCPTESTSLYHENCQNLPCMKHIPKTTYAGHRINFAKYGLCWCHHIARSWLRSHLYCSHVFRPSRLMRIPLPMCNALLTWWGRSKKVPTFEESSLTNECIGSSERGYTLLGNGESKISHQTSFLLHICWMFSSFYDLFAFSKRQIISK